MSISRDVSDKDANSKLDYKILSEKCYSTLEQNNMSYNKSCSKPHSNGLKVNTDNILKPYECRG